MKYKVYKTWYQNKAAHIKIEAQHRYPKTHAVLNTKTKTRTQQQYIKTKTQSTNKQHLLQQTELGMSSGIYII